MSTAHALELESTRKFFLTTLSIFDEADSRFAPHPEMYTVAGQVAHAAITVDWFMAGGFGAGWDENYEEHIRQAKAVTSLATAKAMLVKAFDQRHRDSDIGQQGHAARTDSERRDHARSAACVGDQRDRRPHRASSRVACRLRTTAGQGGADAVCVT